MKVFMIFIILLVLMEFGVFNVLVLIMLKMFLIGFMLKEYVGILMRVIFLCDKIFWIVMLLCIEVLLRIRKLFFGKYGRKWCLMVFVMERVLKLLVVG